MRLDEIMHVKPRERYTNICAVFYNLQSTFKGLEPVQFPHHCRVEYHYPYFLHKEIETKAIYYGQNYAAHNVRTGANIF